MKTKDLIAVESIIAAACSEFGLASEQLLSASRKQSVSEPRHVAMFLTRELTPLSFAEIGRQFGGVVPGTVRFAVRTTGNHIATEPEFRDRVERVRAALATAIAEERASLKH